MSELLHRIRQAAGRAASGPLAGDVERPVFERVGAQSPFPPGAGLEEYVSRFRAELEALTARVYGPFDPDDAASQVIALIHAAASAEPPRHQDTRGPGGFPLPGGEDQGEGPTHHPSPITDHSARVLSWDPAHIDCPGLAERLRAASIELVPGDVPTDDGHQRVLERLAEIKVGLSGAVAGLADTGSIVVPSGPGRARIASLLPLVHIAVLPVSRLHPTTHDWLAAGGAELVGETANVNVITGSSRTSDIELQLTLGMHGPKELHVVLVK